MDALGERVRGRRRHVRVDHDERAVPGFGSKVADLDLRLRPDLADCQLGTDDDPVTVLLIADSDDSVALALDPSELVWHGRRLGRRRREAEDKVDRQALTADIADVWHDVHDVEVLDVLVKRALELKTLLIKIAEAVGRRVG